MPPTATVRNEDVLPTEAACRSFDGWFESVEEKIAGLHDLWLYHVSTMGVELDAAGVIKETPRIDSKYLRRAFQEYASLQDCTLWRQSICSYEDYTRFAIGAALDWMRIQGLRELSNDLQRRERQFDSDTIVRFEEFFRLPNHIGSDWDLVRCNYLWDWETAANPIMAYFDPVARESSLFSAYLQSLDVTAQQILGIDTAAEQDAKESKTETLSPSDAGPEHNATERSILETLRKVGHRMTTEPLLRKAVGKANSHGKATLASLVKRDLLTKSQDAKPRGFGLPEWDQPASQDHSQDHGQD